MAGRFNIVLQSKKQKNTENISVVMRMPLRVHMVSSRRQSMPKRTRHGPRATFIPLCLQIYESNAHTIPLSFRQISDYDEIVWEHAVSPCSSTGSQQYSSTANTHTHTYNLCNGLLFKRRKCDKKNMLTLEWNENICLDLKRSVRRAAFLWFTFHIQIHFCSEHFNMKTGSKMRKRSTGCIWI